MRYQAVLDSIDQIRTPGGIAGGIRTGVKELRSTIDSLMAALVSIAQMGDTGSPLYKALFDPDGVGEIPTGWRVAEKMRERAIEAIDGLEFICGGDGPQVTDRVRIKFGRDRGHYGTIVSKSGDNGDYYGVKLDCHDKPVGYSEYELELAN